MFLWRWNAFYCTVVALARKGFQFVETIYDWITLALFGGLIVLFLERSAKAEPVDHIWQYLVPAVGCAIANYAGNSEQHAVAAILIVGVIAYVHIVLKPFGNWLQR